MEIVEIIKQAGELLGLQNDILILDDETKTETEKLQNGEVKLLLNLLKFSVQELCTNYIPMIVSKSITTSNKKYNVGDLPNFISIQNVFKDGENIKVKIKNRCMNFEEDGNYEIEYKSYPTISSLDDKIDFLSTFSPDVVVFGLCSYYTITRGRFDEFVTFHEMYENKAKSIKDLKLFNLPQRSWM